MKKVLFALLLLLSSVSVSAFAAERTTGVRYVEATLPNISDLLFKKGVLKTDDPAAIEEYIRIHHCGLYEQYGRDDFSWARIRETQARDLVIRFPDMPDGLEVVNWLTMEKYDLATNQFMIATKDQMKDVGILTLLHEKTGSMAPCGMDYSSFVPRMHPLELKLKFDSRLSLSGLPMSRATADEMIALMNARTNPHTKRKVMLALRVRITGVDPLALTTDPMRRVVTGKLDEIRVYEGLERKTLLFRKTFESQPASANKN